MIKHIAILAVMLIFSGCAIRNYKINQASIVIIKSPHLKYADIGYIRHNLNAVELQLFEAGVPIQTIKINHLICINNGCMTKDMFNQRYLTPQYPTNILKNIILGRPIFKAINIKKLPNGFTQTIKEKSLNIHYSKINNMIKFIDKKNHIFIKISSEIP